MNDPYYGMHYNYFPLLKKVDMDILRIQDRDKNIKDMKL